ncbi:MAG: hypothetical protein ACRDMA_10485 [Solirubrobacterales bacterium]
MAASWRSAKQLLERYRGRALIEQRLAEGIRSFHLDALSSAVALNVDLDVTLTVWAAAAYDALRRRLRGYESATPDTIWRRFVSTARLGHAGARGGRRQAALADLLPGDARRGAARGPGALVGRPAPSVRVRLVAEAAKVGVNSLFGNPG